MYERDIKMCLFIIGVKFEDKYRKNLVKTQHFIEDKRVPH